MKKLFFFIGLVAAFSCRDEQDVAPQKGSLSFGFEQKGISNGRENDDATPVAIMISVQKANGTMLFEDKTLPLYNFGPSFTSESIVFEVGDYKLIKLWVLNAKNEVIGVTPLTGSINSNKVSAALPIAFKIVGNQSTQLACEVVKVQQDAAAYGYGGFGIKFVNEPKSIKLNFVASTNPNMQTHGYDSVVMTFINGTTVLKKNLQVISPVQAVGKITESELSGNGVCGICWTVNVSAYYESIDEVLYNLHINEAKTSTSFMLNALTSEIKIDGGKLRLFKDGNFEYLSLNVAWENWAHLSDNAGTFKFTVNNDLCNPTFHYELLRNVNYYGYASKVLYMNDQQYGNMRFIETPMTGGKYDTSNAFENMCPLLPNSTLTGDIYFVVDSDKGMHDCYLVWMFENTPIDPDGSASGKFKMFATPEKAKSNGRLRSGR